jgi:hypothetical protein
MADREQADVLDDVFHAVQKEDHADEERQMVVAGDHVLRAQVHQGTNRRSLDALEKHCVLAGHAVGTHVGPAQHRQRRSDSAQRGEPTTRVDI